MHKVYDVYRPANVAPAKYTTAVGQRKEHCKVQVCEVQVVSDEDMVTININIVCTRTYGLNVFYVRNIARRTKQRVSGNPPRILISV